MFNSSISRGGDGVCGSNIQIFVLLNGALLVQSQVKFLVTPHVLFTAFGLFKIVLPLLDDLIPRAL